MAKQELQPTRSSLPTHYGKPGVSYIRAIAKRAEVPAPFADFVIDARLDPIAAMEDEKAMAALMLQIPAIAKEYGVRKDIPPRTQAECVRLVMEKFPKLAIIEIKEAFRQWAVGEITPRNAEFYDGEFSASHLGRILAAYKQRRQKVESQYLDVVATHERRDEQEQKAKAKRQQFEENFILKLQSPDEFKSWRDVPFWYYNLVMNRGYMEPSKQERRLAWKYAESLSEETKHMMDEFVEDFKERRVSIAKRLIVFRRIKIQGFCFKPTQKE